MAAERVDHGGRPRDITAGSTQRLAERALDHVDLVRQPVPLRDAAALRAVHAHGVHLIQVGERTVPPGDGADLRRPPEIAIHGIDAFEGDELGAACRLCRQEPLQMGGIVVPEDLLLAA